jgi:hypothetical protein
LLRTTTALAAAAGAGSYCCPSLSAAMTADAGGELPPLPSASRSAAAPATRSHAGAAAFFSTRSDRRGAGPGGRPGCGRSSYHKNKNLRKRSRCDRRPPAACDPTPLRSRGADEAGEGARATQPQPPRPPELLPAAVVRREGCSQSSWVLYCAKSCSSGPPAEDQRHLRQAPGRL